MGYSPHPRNITEHCKGIVDMNHEPRKKSRHQGKTRSSVIINWDGDPRTSRDDYSEAA